jgi:hypothetical protein
VTAITTAPVHPTRLEAPLRRITTHALCALLPALVVAGVALAAPAQSLASVSVASDNGSSLYVDYGSSSPTLRGGYVGYTVSTTTAQSDV